MQLPGCPVVRCQSRSSNALLPSAGRIKASKLGRFVCCESLETLLKESEVKKHDFNLSVYKGIRHFVYSSSKKTGLRPFAHHGYLGHFLTFSLDNNNPNPPIKKRGDQMPFLEKDGSTLSGTLTFCRHNLL